jgi:hypothetical protein
MEVFQYPHNILLNLWSEVGLLGIIAFSWILVRWIRFSAADHPRPWGTLDVAIPVIAALIVHGFVDVPYFKNDLAVAFWLFVIMTTAGASSLPRRA